MFNLKGVANHISKWRGLFSTADIHSGREKIPGQLLRGEVPVEIPKEGFEETLWSKERETIADSSISCPPEGSSYIVRELKGMYILFQVKSSN